MLARLQTFSLVGVDAVPVDVEVDVSGGALPASDHVLGTTISTRSLPSLLEKVPISILDFTPLSMR